MKVLVKTKDLSREEWLRYRTKGIVGLGVSMLNIRCDLFQLLRNP